MLCEETHWDLLCILYINIEGLVMMTKEKVDGCNNARYRNDMKIAGVSRWEVGDWDQWKYIIFSWYNLYNLYMVQRIIISIPVNMSLEYWYNII